MSLNLKEWFNIKSKDMNTTNMKEQIKDIGNYNCWRGRMGLYFTQKQLRSLKKFGITSAPTLQEAYNLIQ